MTHCLGPDQIIDALDGTADRAATAHLDACPQCQAAVAEVRDTRAALEGVEVPEPSPHFWSQVNARVRAAVDDEARTYTAPWWAWPRWDVVVPMAGLATIVVALTTAIGRVPATVPSSPAAEAGVAALELTSSDSPAVVDDAFELMLDLAATLPGSEWDTLGVSALPDLGVAAQALSADEQQALSAILQAAVERPRS